MAVGTVIFAAALRHRVAGIWPTVASSPAAPITTRKLLVISDLRAL